MVKCICSDNGGEYVNNMTKTIFAKYGILHKAMPPYNHEMNGVVERYNRTIITDAEVMLDLDNMLFLWAESIATAISLRNIKLHISLEHNIMPHEALYKKKLMIKHLQPFLQQCYVHIPVEAHKPRMKLLD
jgi:transposase InsO family protein